MRRTCRLIICALLLVVCGITVSFGNSSEAEPLKETKVISNEQSSKADATIGANLLIDRNELEELKKTNKSILINGDEYTLQINGNQIVNCGNSVDGSMHVEKEEGGFFFCLNHGNSLPGVVKITISVKTEHPLRFVYLEDETNGKYQYFGKLSNNSFETDIPGVYHLTNKKISQKMVRGEVMVIVAIFIIALVVAYIVIRRRYWLW